MRLTLIIKLGTKVLGEFPGLIDIDPKVSELETVPSIEQMLERFLGYRFHINIELKGGENVRDKA